MVTEVSVKVPADSAKGAYMKFEKRAGDFAVASVAVQLTPEDSWLGGAAISIGAVGPKPIRVPAAEALLNGCHLSKVPWEAVAQHLGEAAQPFADTRGSVEYKRHLTGALFARAASLAIDRMGP
jgi:carbon-monoxide dehydrogenase medium subunit